jgi:RNA polymerase sigma-70 factor (ECF subfamily)
MTAYQQNAKKKELLTLGYQNYAKGLHSHAFFKISDHDIGDDLVQETFLKTWKYLVRGGKIDVMRAFLYHILNNLIVDQYRRQKTSSLDILFEHGFDPTTDDNNTEQLINKLDGKEALLLISNLPISYQKIMRMKYVQGLTLKEMSLLTGQSKNTLAVQAHRGLEKLKFLYSRSALNK